MHGSTDTDKTTLDDLFKDYFLFSTGFNCFLKLWIKTFKSQETQLFDWMGVYSHALSKILDMNRSDIFYKDCYIKTNSRLCDSQKAHKNILTHKDLYLQLVHDRFLTEKQLETKYTKRLEKMPIEQEVKPMVLIQLA